MILKICELDSDNVWMYDNLSTVRSDHTKEKHGMNYLCNEMSSVPPIKDIIGLDFFDTSKSMKIEFLQVFCRDIYGNEFRVAFRGSAYLCNDDNKTLEAIRW